MEFTQLIAPSGEWGKIWLAAHWEKRLKKQDYVDIDLRALIASFMARRAILSLRATGHLLVGGCKVFARKCEILEEEVQEVRQKLFMAFSDKARQQRGGDDAVAAGGAGPLGGLLREVDAELSLAEPQDEDALLGGRRHLARLEDITLRAPPVADLRADLTAGLAGLGVAGEELGTQAECEAVLQQLREFFGTANLPPGFPQPGAEPAAALDTQPLVGADGPQEEEAEARGSKRPLEPETPTAVDLDTPMPLEMDLPPAEDDDLQPLDAAALGLEEPEDLGLAEEGAAERMPDIVDRDAAPKRRRRDRCIFDEVTEIPKATYQEYMNDRSKITRDKILDYTIVLPHYSRSLPDFMTTFTDLCPELTQCLRLGKEVAEKVRVQRKELETAALTGREAALPLADLARLGEPKLPLSNLAAAAALLDPSNKDLTGRGRSSPSRGPAAAESRTERELLKDAPRTMSAVVLANPDGEDAACSSEARVGYSGRTEKMHRYLAREFQEASADALCYQDLCKKQARGRRELVAGSFFELLVLKTNGVIGLQQEAPLSDIRISKASQFAA